MLMFFSANIFEAALQTFSKRVWKTIAQFSQTEEPSLIKIIMGILDVKNFL